MSSICGVCRQDSFANANQKQFSNLAMLAKGSGNQQNGLNTYIHTYIHTCSLGVITLLGRNCSCLQPGHAGTCALVCGRRNLTEEYNKTKKKCPNSSDI